MISQALLSTALSYSEYKSLLERLLKEGKTTGTNQSDEYINFAKINLQRMHRLEKTSVLSPELLLSLSKISKSYIWLVISEGWCGDASQNVPIIQKITDASPLLDFKLILRDEHLDIMDRYLTNGSRSIPKLICLEKDTLKEVFVWGPRPKILQTIVSDLLAKGVSKEDKGIITQKWYNEDKSKSLQNELTLLLQTM